jgi:hypothetical protein
MYGARRVILKLGIGRCGLSVLYTFSRVEQGDNLQWLWFGGFVITTISPNILRKFDERNLCSALHLKGEKKEKQNGAQDENLTLLHCSVETAVLLLVGSGRMEDRDSHLSDICTLCTVNFMAVVGSIVLKAERNCFFRR